jgi:hypothetical protein
MIKIEVTGITIPELADKLLAIGASLQGTVAVYDTPARKTSPKKVMPEVAVVHSSIEDEPLEVIDLPVADTPTINFETEIRPLALKVVEQRSKPVLEEILSRFGVARASLVPAARMSELHAALQEALSK